MMALNTSAKLDVSWGPFGKFHQAHRFLLPVKFMFFFQLGAVACLVPFMPVFIQSLGLNAAEMGIIFGALPFLALLSKPATGFVTDRFPRPYRLLQIFLIVQIIFMFSVYFVPPMGTDTALSISCNATDTANSNCSANTTVILSTVSTIGHRPVQAGEALVVRSTLQFWLVGVLMTIAWFAAGAVMILDDSVTIKLVGQSPTSSSYGANRAWGTAGFAVFALIVGLIMQHFAASATSRNFTPAFLAFGITAVVGLLTTFFLPTLVTKLDDGNLTGNAVLRKFFTWDVTLFSFGTLIIGIDSGFLHAYLAWYQAELGASNFLLGLTIFVECCYETPMMALSDKVIRKLGYHNCMFLCIASFGVRFVCYALVDDPWMVLPIDILHALGFGLFYATMTSFAYVKSPAGNGATLQGILSAICDGIGQGAGGLVAGFLYQEFGGRRTWMGYGFFSFAAAALYAAGGAYLWFRAKRRTLRKRETAEDFEEKEVLETPLSPQEPRPFKV